VPRAAPRLVPFVLALLGAGCERSAPPGAATTSAPAIAPTAATSTAAAPPTPTPTPASTTASTPTSTPTPAKAPAVPATAILRAAFAVEPAARLALAPGSENVVHPASTFEVELSARTPDARLVLVDARDDLVPATAARELTAGTRLTLSPAAPLVPGARYALRLDGASERDLHDDAGRAIGAITLPLLASGAPPPAPKKGAKHRKQPPR
jgi:hypothetical protein